MKDQEFVYSSTAVRTLESKLLTKDQIRRMVEAPNMDGALRVLHESSYSDSFSKIGRPEDYEDALAIELKDLYETIDDISPYEIISYIAKLKYDLQDMKILFKDHVMGTDNSKLMSPIGNLRIEEIQKATEEGKRKELDELLGGLATDAVHGYGESMNPQSIDLAVDRRFYRRLLELSEESDVGLMKEYARDYTDFSNIVSLFRMKNQNRDASYVEDVVVYEGNIKREDLIHSYNEPVEVIASKFKNEAIGPRLMKGLEEYEKTGSIASFEIEFDNHLIDLAKKSKYKTFGPEVLFAYLIAKEMEIKNIRLILVSKANGLDSSAIEKRLRETYV